MQAAALVPSPLFLLLPHSLTDSVVATPELQLLVHDSIDDYGTSEGDGAWIYEYLQWVADKWVDLTQQEEAVQWSDCTRFDNDTFRAALTTTYHRNIIVEFTNKYYVEWRDSKVAIPDIDDVDDYVQDHLCSECDNDDVWENEYDLTQAPINPEEWYGWEAAPHSPASARIAVLDRNEALREHMEAAYQNWVDTREVTGRTNICDDRCNSFYESQNQRMRHAIGFNLQWLDEKWQTFVGRSIQLPPIPRPVNVIPMPELCLEPLPVEPLRPLKDIAKEARRLRRGW